MPTFNFSSSDFRPEPLAPGSYEMAIESIEDTITRKTNKPMIKVTYDCVHQGYEGRKAWQNIVLPAAKYQVALLLRATGEYTEEDIISPNFHFEYDDLIGRRVGVVLTPSMYNGQPTTNVKRTCPVDECEGPSGESMPAASASQRPSSGGLL